MRAEAADLQEAAVSKVGGGTGYGGSQVGGGARDKGQEVRRKGCKAQSARRKGRPRSE